MASSKPSGLKTAETVRSEDWADLTTGTSFALLIAPDGTILAANEAVAQRLEIPLSRFVGSCIYDHFPVETAARRRAMAAMALETGVAQSYEDVSSSGNVLDTVIHPVLGADGKAVTLAVFATDVTGQRRIMHERLRMATAIEQAVEAVVIYDTDFSIRYVNQAFEEMTGYSQSEVRGRSGELLYQGRHQQKSLGLIRTAMAEGEAWTGRTFNTRKDGRVIQVEKTVSPIRGRFGVPLGWVSVWRDVTHVAVLEKQLRQAQSMEAIGTLAGGIAHDFNNILGPIILHSELGQTMVPEGSPAHLSFSEILEAANRARALVDQILSLSRKHEADEPVLFRLSSICKECIKFLRPSLPATIAIVEDQRAEDDTILADPTQIHQVVMNLATNAAYAMREQGGTLTLAVQAVDLDLSMRSLFPDAGVGSYVMLTVKDTGQGMPKEHLERVFDPFFTTKKSLGTGLGLTVVHNIVTRHGGAVRLESSPGVGTAFHVLLPRSESPGLVPAETLIASPILGSGQVLFVDDEAALRTSTSMALTQLGYEVTCCASGQEAYDLFRAHPERYALVLADVTMPGMTGLDLARRIQDEHPEARVVLTSGYSDLINPEKARELGLGYLKKPYSTAALGLAVREVLDPGGK
ncbi:MAG: PAS domain-containing protein [Proteobacteria bacterium]|nr:PAS domain-containing protein [Pseudomonadota bacterium]